MAQQREAKMGCGSPLLEKSKQTYSERRKVRIENRELLENIRGKGQRDVILLHNKAFQDMTKKQNDIFKNVYYPREANLDASNLDEFSNVVVKQAGMMGSSDLTKFDVADLIQQAQKKCASDDGNGQFNWERLGSAVGACFQAPIAVNFLYGSMVGLIAHEIFCIIVGCLLGHSSRSQRKTQTSQTSR
jgi:hypothetical protein